MQFKLFAFSLIAGLASAGEVLDVVNSIPECAILCYNNAAVNHNCSPTDFKCVCNNPSIITEAATKCDSCSLLESANVAKTLGQLCIAFANRPTETDVLNASSALAADITKVSATHRSAAIANAPPAVKGAMGAAAVGIAVLALY